MNLLPEITVEQFVDHISDSDLEYDYSLSKKILITSNKTTFSIKNVFLDDVILTNTKDKTETYSISERYVNPDESNWRVIENQTEVSSTYSTEELIEFLNSL